MTELTPKAVVEELRQRAYAPSMWSDSADVNKYLLRTAAALIAQQADEIESLERRMQIAADHAAAAEENVSDLAEDLAQAKAEIERLRGVLEAAPVDADFANADEFRAAVNDWLKAEVAAALFPVEKEKG